MSEEEKALKIEKGPNIEIEKGEQTEKGENAEQIAEKTKILAAKVTEKGNEFREEIKNRKPGEGIIEEFNKGEEAIEEEAKNAAKIIINDNNMENKNRGEFSRELTINEVFDSITERAKKIYSSDMSIAEKKQQIKILFDEQTEATTNDKRFNDIARKAGKWRDAGNILYEIDEKLVLEESEEKFDEAFKSVEAYNQTMPNYFKKRSENLGKIVDELRNKKVDPEIIFFVKKIVIDDRKDMINAMCRKENIDIYYANPGSDKSNMELSSPDLYIENLLKNNIKESEIEKQLKDIDNKLTAVINDFSIDLFAGEYEKARIFFEKVNKSNNPKERQVYCVVIKHILDGIEKGIEDKGTRGALKNKF